MRHEPAILERQGRLPDDADRRAVMDNREIAEMIFEKYVAAYGANLQGCCPLIADELQQAIGGDVVAGELTWYGGSCRRTHWWVEKDGETLDPMGDDFLRTEEATGRLEAHRNMNVFYGVLPLYEKWRV